LKTGAAAVGTAALSRVEAQAQAAPDKSYDDRGQPDELIKLLERLVL
jgi:hypothetical protein